MGRTEGREYSTTESSHPFRVTDVVAFLKAMRQHPSIGVTVDGDSVVIFGQHTHGSDLRGEPTGICLESPIEVIAPHLPDGEVVIMTSVTITDTHQYQATSLAFNSRGETREVKLASILELAKELGEPDLYEGYVPEAMNGEMMGNAFGPYSYSGGTVWLAEDEPVPHYDEEYEYGGEFDYLFSSDDLDWGWTEMRYGLPKYLTELCEHEYRTASIDRNKSYAVRECRKQH